MTAMLVFTVPGRPVSWERNGGDGRSGRRHVTTAAQRAEKKRIWLCARQALGAKPWDRSGEFVVEVRAYYPDRRFGDVDRIPGLDLDALEGLAYEKDRQVCDLVVRRRVDKARPRVEVVVRPFIHLSPEDERAVETALVIDGEVRR